MDLTTGAVVLFGIKTVGKPTADVLTQLVERFLGPSVDVGGEALRDWIKSRTGRGEAVLRDAVQMLAEVGQEPQPVPGRILLPILEHGSLEEDDILHKRWAGLLANAASAGQGDNILPGYIEVLKQLTPIHVRVLDWVFTNAEGPSEYEPSLSVWRDVTQDEVAHRHGLNTADWELLASDLHRLQVIDGRRYIQTRHGGGMSSASSYSIFGLTPLGIAFIKACRPPQSAQRR